MRDGNDMGRILERLIDFTQPDIIVIQAQI